MHASSAGRMACVANERTRNWLRSRVLMAALVAQKMKFGVSRLPCGVVKRPTRAREDGSEWVMEKENMENNRLELRERLRRSLSAGTIAHEIDTSMGAILLQSKLALISLKKAPEAKSEKKAAVKEEKKTEAKETKKPATRAKAVKAK